MDSTPNQLALDRIQRAGTRSPLIVGDTMVVYELCEAGVCLKGRRASSARAESGRVSRTVSWSDLGLSEADPLLTAHKEVLAQLWGRRR